MTTMTEWETDPEQRDRERRLRRIEERRRRKKQVMIRLIMLCAAGAVVLIGLVFFLFHLIRGIINKKKTADLTEAALSEENASGEDLFEEYFEEISGDAIIAGEEETAPEEAQEEETMEEIPEEEVLSGNRAPSDYAGQFFSDYSPVFNEETRELSKLENMTSEYAILIDLSDGHVVAAKNAETVMYPASMTKILTVLTALDYDPNLDDTVTMTEEIAQYTYDHDCSRAGFSAGETLSVRDLFYGTILPSGADAVLMLSDYCTPSREEFVERMNGKAKELGLSEEKTHFENPIGLFSEDNHTTVSDMAMILKAAEENAFLSEVLKSRKYTTTPSAYHPNGVELSNLFLRRIEDKDTHGEVMGAKTGYVNQSGNCAASFLLGDDGKSYICVTGKAQGSWNCIDDHVAIYEAFVPGGTVSENEEGE